MLSQFGVGHAPVALKQFENLCVDRVDAGQEKTFLNIHLMVRAFCSK
jgi:hypothetical protein